jgi:hypothetical protein
MFGGDPGHVAGPQTYQNLSDKYREINDALKSAYGHVARTARSHTIDWVGWVDMARIEAEAGTRLDLNYYHYWQFNEVLDPARFPAMRFPTQKSRAHGYFTGSGLPQRFCDETGAILPIYQLLTEWSDEFFADNKDTTIDGAGVTGGFLASDVVQIVKSMLLDAENGFYSAFVNNIHHGRYVADDPITQIWAHSLWDHAAAQGIPMWSAEKFLDFVEARNAGCFDNLSWTGTRLTFDFTTPMAGQDLTLMLPAENLLSIELDGTPVAFTSDVLKGRSYALFTTQASSTQVVAKYGHAWVETTVADFGNGSLDGVQVVRIGDGSVTLDGNLFADDFTQAVSPDWESWPASGDLTQTAKWHVSNGVFVHDFNKDVPTYHPAVLSALHTPTGDFSCMARQRITQVTTGPGDSGVLGFIVGGQDSQNYYIIQYAQQGLGLKIYRRHTGLANFTLIGNASVPDPVIGQWYDMRVDVVGTTFNVYIDGSLRLTATDAAYIPGRIGLLGYEGGRSEHDDVVVSSGVYTRAGIYTSKVFDALAPVQWESISWTSDTPAGTVLAISVRTGDTPVPDSTWTLFSPKMTSGNAIATSSQYLQYRVILATTADLLTPVLKEVRILYSSS